ncbi:winged helix-turn-helix transcriptional regulator [Patulibacter medicamentivorans]|uniref:winged helix-turn-helix transcriptional regulator n=1 Tax=Patulibacter medicamentivorans TaxID=1097667 RepID=UPI0014784809|nr:winged helix-turn-helix transcriptional regulator [Patulibacter medicamentivorans]
MLIIRNLLHGPKRFTDLEKGLPGIGGNLLTQRLRHLGSAGLVERVTLAPPAASVVYQLTADGRGLHQPLIELTRWGLGRQPPIDNATTIDATWIMLGLEARFEPEGSADLGGVYELRIDDAAHRLEVRDETLTIRAGHADDPLATVATSASTIAALNEGRDTLHDAVAAQRLVVSGDVERAVRLARAFGL